MNELNHRGLMDILVAVVDGLKGFPEAISVPRHGFSWERGRFSGALFRGNWRVGYGVI